MGDLEKLSSAAIERNVIALVSQNESSWLETQDMISAQDFYYPLNRALYHAVSSLYERGGRVDPVLLTEALPKEQRDELDKLGGWDYIGALKELPLDPRNAVLEAARLKDLSLKRRVAQAGERIGELAYDSTNSEKLMDEAEVALLDAASAIGPEVVLLGSGSMKFAEERAASPAEVPGLMSGFKRLDKHLQGFQPSRLYVVAARLKVGKSTTLLNWAANIVKDGTPVLYISTEHSHDDERSRFLSLISGVPEHRIRNGTYSLLPELAEQVEKAALTLESLPIYFCSMPDFNIRKIKNLTRKFVRMHGVKALFFDYIKTGTNSGVSGDFKEYLHLGQLSDGLKELASSLKIPVISAVQMNRESAYSMKREEEVGAEGVAGSDRIAAFASVLLHIRYPSKGERDKCKVYGEPRILTILANRHGGANYTAVVDFEAPVLRMDETDIDLLK